MALPPQVNALLDSGPGIPPAFASSLGIPNDLLKKIRDAAFEANDEVITLEATLKRARLGLDRALGEAAPEEKRVIAKLEEVAQSELAVRKNRMRLLLRVRSLLGPELWQKLQALEVIVDARILAADRELVVEAGKTMALAIPDLARVAVSTPEIADIEVKEGRVVITGRGDGQTTMLVWSKDGTLTNYRITVRPPAGGPGHP